LGGDRWIVTDVDKGARVQLASCRKAIIASHVGPRGGRLFRQRSRWNSTNVFDAIRAPAHLNPYSSHDHLPE
jgi:hypothetical protein